MAYQNSQMLLNQLVFEDLPTTTVDEIKEDLKIWTHTQFAFDTPIHSPSSSSPSSTVINPDITYENLANYLDYELPTYHALIQDQTLELRSLTSDSLSAADAASRALIASLFTTPATLEQCDKISPDEEKKKRNTAASARFRMKKKQKESKLEANIREMTDKSNILQNRVSELEAEISLMKSLLIERSARN